MLYLSRTEASEFLTEKGFPVAKNTLQKYATVGGGPLYAKFGNRCLYQESQLLEWAESKLEPCRNTSDLDTSAAS